MAGEVGNVKLINPTTQDAFPESSVAKKNSSLNSLRKPVVNLSVKGGQPNPGCVALAFFSGAIALIGVALLLRYAVGVKALVPTAGPGGNVLYSMVTIHQRGVMVAGASLLGIGGVGAALFTAGAIASSR